MERPLEIILLIVPMVAGAIAILLAYRLMRKHSLPYLNSYFYFLVFLYIFGSYSLIGSGIIEQLLTRSAPDSQIGQTSRLYAVWLGIPFLVLSTYMFIRAGMEMAGRNLRGVFAIVYFVLAMTGFLLYGFFLVRLTRFGMGEYLYFMGIQKWVFASFLLLVHVSMFVAALVFSRNQPHHERRLARTIYAWYLPYVALADGFFIFSGRIELLSFGFIFIFLSWHLIPLLYLNLFLGEYNGDRSSVQKDFEQQLAQFCREYQITKREKEVISLISRGLSNQEISDSLYISLQTVKDHVHRIFVKTGVKNRIQLTNVIRSSSP